MNILEILKSLEISKVLEILGVLVGLIYLYLEYKGNIYLWIAGFIMPVIYIKVYHDAGLYADMACNIYYLLATVYGLTVWIMARKKRIKAGKKAEMPITSMPILYWSWIALISIIIFITIGYGLDNYTDSTVPYIDSFTTTLSIVGLWQLAQKYIEQWLTWIVVDIVSTGLYFYKGLSFTAGLYLIYSVIAVAGYFQWKKMMIRMEKENA
ncbi:MAG: nicotinamide riboside transporter PnuC [Bacteroidaceae bacterium]